MVQYDPFSPEVMEDPHPIYKQLRDEAPAYYIQKYDAWALSRFQDIWDCSSNPAFSTAKGTTSSQLLTKVQPVTPMLNLMDPPDHTQLRAGVKSYLAPKKVRALESFIRQNVTEHLDKLIPQGEFDLMIDFAQQLSVKVACTAIGIPLEDGDYMNDLVWRFFARDPEVEGMTEDGLKAAVELTEYFMRLLEDRRKTGHDDDDIINMFRNVEMHGRKFSDEELGSHYSMLIIGGSETFPKTLANIVRRLWEHPDQRTQCAADPSLIPEAYLEGLRYDMPTQFLGRSMLQDVELHGTTLKAGQPVLFLYTAANRDEREFPNPDVFDIKRQPPRILSFGAGTHMCIGLHVAKMEGKVCLEEMLSRIPDYEVDLDQAERLRTEFVQGFASLPIRCQAK